MNIGVRVVLLVAWLYVIFTCALLLFSKGFLLKRVVINNASHCYPNHWLVSNLWNGIRADIRIQNIQNKKTDPSCQMQLKPKFKKAILVIIDGLRYDFLTYKPNLDLKSALPFENKMVKLHQLIKEQPTNGKLFKFEADPPTTTMQRIKGITTGSLPTFIDAGTNFNSYEITEDNILSQALKQKKNISFMGCSTWTELFPSHFHRKIPFSALNVKDLDTIDYGIIRNLIPEVKRKDWSLLIAHFLGVDHCGHRYGTHHPEMTRKLTEMDKVIKDLTDAIDEDTVLFVMGDHGMTRSGDHGGDSKDEVMAGLFTYSKKGLFTPVENQVNLPQVSQIDMVPTLSLLLDQPIPFSNLGSVMPHFFQGPHGNFLPSYMEHTIKDAMHKEMASKLFQQINAAYTSYLNTKQLFDFIQQYQDAAKDLPVTKIEIARNSFEFLEEKFEEYLREVLLIDFLNKTTLESQIANVEESVQELQNIHESLQDVLHDIKATCRSIWAKFDLYSMTMGISLMAFLSCFVLAAPHFMNMVSLTEPGRFFGLITTFGYSFCLVAVFFSAVGTEDSDKDSMVVFLALSFSFSLWLLSINVIPSVPSLKLAVQNLVNNTALNLRLLLFSFCFLVQAGSFFANSYIIHEDSVTLFICQSLVVASLTSYFLEIVKEAKATDPKRQGRSKAFVLIKTRLMRSICTRSNVVVFGEFAVVLLCLRITKFFWFCREMQLKCSWSSYVLPLVSLMSEFTAGHVHERLLVAFVSLVGIAVITYFYLRKKGNLNGSTPASTSVKYIAVFMVITILLHWCLQIMLTHEMSKLFDVQNLQQIILPRLVYLLFLFSLAAILYQPLPVYIYHKKKFNSQSEISELYHQIRKTLTGTCTDKDRPDDKKIVVYGLKSVYSSALIVLLFMLLVVTCMVMMDGMTLPLFCLWLAGFGLTNIFAIKRRSSTMGDMFISCVMWLMFSSLGFYGTGHQNTIPSVRYPAAYIGFRGSIPEIVPQVLVILLNTFASQLLCSLALPLLMIFKKIIPTSLDIDNEKTVSAASDDSEIDITENKNHSYFDLFRITITYFGLIITKVSFAAGAAALHRRHLMVWKIFAPRFMFESVAFLLVLPMLMAGLLFFKRVDNSVANWFENLQNQK